MTWVKLDDHFHDHPKIEVLTSDAYRAFIGGLCYCTRYLTDGTIPLSYVRKLARKGVVAELVQGGLWEQNGHGTVSVHDYLDHQWSRSEIEARRLANAKAGRSGGLASAKAKRKRKLKRKRSER